MICKLCQSADVQNEFCGDNQNEGYAFNVFHCNKCNAICKQDVWENAGEIWIGADGEIFREVQPLSQRKFIRSLLRGETIKLWLAKAIGPVHDFEFDDAYAIEHDRVNENLAVLTDALELADDGAKHDADSDRQKLLGALADIAFSNDMTLGLARAKAKRVYDECAPDIEE